MFHVNGSSTSSHFLWNCSHKTYENASTDQAIGLLETIGCRLQSTEGRAALQELRGQHIHLWQSGEDYHILVVSADPAVGAALGALANLEADCQAHTHDQQAPELAHNEEGYLLVARGPQAFLFARLFLALEQEVEPAA